MSRRFALVLVAGASAAMSPQEPPACAAPASSAPVLLQTQRSVERATMYTEDALDVADGIMLPPLPPPFVLPPHPAAEEHIADMVSPEPALAQVTGMPTQHTDQDWANYMELKELRRTGFTCPGGQYFPPNDGELLFDCRLWKTGYLHSLDMGTRNYFAHVTPEGKNPYDRSKEQGFGTYYENIAAGSSTASATLGQWKKSDGHCTNMMKAEHNRIGVGYAYVEASTYRHYWTQMFATSYEQVDTSCYRSGAGASITTTRFVSSTVACTDTSSNCASWVSAGYCASTSNYYAMMGEQCSRSCNFCSGSGGSDASTGGGQCVDNNANCASWANAGYCASSSTYYAYMKAQCSNACAFCGGSGGGAGTTPVPSAGGGRCEDSNSNCASWANAGYCTSSSTYYGYMKANCGRSCAFCGGMGSTTRASSCQDQSFNCASYKSSGYCSDGNTYQPWMRANCQNACGWCR